MNPYNLIKNNISLGKSRDEVELRAQMKVVGKGINFITVYLYINQIIIINVSVLTGYAAPFLLCDPNLIIRLIWSYNR